MSFLAVPPARSKTRLSPADFRTPTEVIPPLLRKENYKSATISVVGSGRETCEPMKPVPPITRIRMQEG
jgi:hypothetical protein